MGVPVRLTVYAPSEATARTACRAAFDRFAALEDVMSDYRPTSELMRLCANAGQGPQPVSDDLWRVLERAQRLARLSDGAFDVTVGPLVRLWRVARKTARLPDAPALAEAKARVGWRKVRLDPEKRTVALETPGMQLDLGGIAKGFACDEAQKALRAHGVDRALVEAGGDIVVSGPPPGADGWRVDAGGGETRVLVNGAISTSGDTEQFVEIGGVRYSHVVDPRTGLGLTSRVAVTVIAPDGLTSDSLSTALGVLGEPQGRWVAYLYPGVRAVFRRPVAAD
jgi:Membrane-associated lipoprotein involved in thiamine biosynthesis